LTQPNQTSVEPRSDRSKSWSDTVPTSQEKRMNSPEPHPRNDDEGRAAPNARHLHMRLRKPHRTRTALSHLREELKSLYDELSAALLPAGKGKK